CAVCRGSRYGYVINGGCPIRSRPHLRHLASRAGALFHHVYLRDSEKELLFSHDGHRYRTLVKIDCQSEKQEGFIWKDGESMVKGKISEYAKYIKELFGSPALFFASVFCAQNSAKLSDMTTGELKGLFSEFLRLDLLQQYESTAKQAASVADGKLGQIDSRIAGVKEKIKGKEALESRLTALKAEDYGNATTMNGLEEELKTARARIEALGETIKSNSLISQKREMLTEAIARIQEDLAKDKAKAEGDIKILQIKYQGLEAEAVKCADVLKDKDAIEGAANVEKKINGKIEQLSSELDQVTKDTSRLKDDIHGIELAISTIQQKANEIDRDPELAKMDLEAAALTSLHDGYRRDIRDIDNDRRTLDLNIHAQQCRERMAALNLKDPTCKSTSCSFIVEALSAEETLLSIESELREHLNDLQKKRDGIQTEMDGVEIATGALMTRRLAYLNEIGQEKERLAGELASQNTTFTTKKETLRVMTRHIDEIQADLGLLRKDLVRVKQLSEKQAEVQLAEFRLSDLRKMQMDIMVEGKAARQAWSEREADVNTIIQADQEKLNALVIDTEAEGALIAATGAAEAIENVQLPAIKKIISDVCVSMRAVTADLERINDAEEDLQAAQTERGQIALEISEWTYLRNACGKNGLQALEIDGAAPLISGYANKLLSRAFGPLFTVRLRTQDDEGRECLDIVVIVEDGSEILLDNLSGGQRTWILMALRLAMTLLSKEKSQRGFQTAFFDEMDGPLDPDNSKNFMGLYQAFRKEGEFLMLLFISHKPDCRAMADHILTFEYGTNPTWN
ncbi:MAG: SMC family ATPase, partial [Candidatus Altiarchaeota archaeon]|nr:SMC family ATPase [Candidatus Altiarchaeota archaeon]